MKNAAYFLLVFVAALLPGCEQRKFTVRTANMLPAFPVDSRIVVNTSERPQLYEVGAYRVFRPEVQEMDIYIGRLGGMPGDTVEMKKGQLYVNGRMTDHHLVVHFVGESVEKQIDSSLVSDDEHMLRKKEILYRTFADKQMAKFQDELVRIGNKELAEVPQYNSIIGGKPENGWTSDNMGPLVIPEKNGAILVTKENYCLYADLLLYHEGLEELNVTLLPKKFVFKNSYYFFIGDNRRNSEDSRHFGLIPEKNVYGTVKLEE
ncbi:MAG TPA: S26 family signal peptidase [Patescibacteria group bacterium]|nr:S26 family signal peptidase [Patescibacteria group bacterium]